MTGPRPAGDGAGQDDTGQDDAPQYPLGPSGLPVGDLLAGGPITAGLPTPAVVLAIGAHPDDVEFGCGATLARWAGGGASLHAVVLTDGSKGTWDAEVDLTVLVKTRMEECRAAAAVLDGPTVDRRHDNDRLFFLQRVDGELEDGIDERRELARIIRLVKPDVVLGHDPWRRYRLHPDHRAAGQLTVDAVVAARDHAFFPELELAPHRPRALLLWEADLPNHVEDARGFEAAKIAALRCHRSQFKSTMGISAGGTGAGDGSAEAVAAFTRKVGHQLAQHGSLRDLPAAEAFRLITDL